jgi:putative hydrolase of the HAD superfamily
MTSVLVDFLWAQQPTKNLWRRPIPGMVELIRDLSVRGVRLGIVSNSEGRLAELLDEMHLAQFFHVVADSGVLGFEKPDPRIFAHAANGLGVETGTLLHVGDAWEADVMGALGVGASALWVSSSDGGRDLPPRVELCAGAAEIRTALRKRGFPA